MFQFGRFPSVTYVFSYGSTVLHRRGCPIRKSAGQRLFPSNRGLSQVITSFVGSQCQGIHLTLFFAWTAVCYSPFTLSSSLGIFSFFAWASQIIVFGLWIKRPFWFYNSRFLSTRWAFTHLRTKLFWSFSTPPTLVYGKTFKNNFLTSFSQYTTICFVSLYFIRFSMSICLNSFEFWWRWWDSNPWPPACRAGALPAELHPQIIGNLLFLRFVHPLGWW